MASFYREGNVVRFGGFKGVVTQVTETYRKNVIVVKLTERPRYKNHIPQKKIGLFEYPDGRLEFMSFID